MKRAAAIIKILIGLVIIIFFVPIWQFLVTVLVKLFNHSDSTTMTEILVAMPSFALIVLASVGCIAWGIRDLSNKNNA